MSKLTKEQKLLIEAHQMEYFSARGIKPEHIGKQRSISIDLFPPKKSLKESILIPKDWVTRYWIDSDFDNTKNQMSKRHESFMDYADHIFLHRKIYDQIGAIRKTSKINIKTFAKLRKEFVIALTAAKPANKEKENIKRYIQKVSWKRVKGLIARFGLSPALKDSIVEFILTDRCSMPQRNAYVHSLEKSCLYIYGNASRRMFEIDPKDRITSETRGIIKSKFWFIEQRSKKLAALKNPNSPTNISIERDPIGLQSVCVLIGKNTTEETITRRLWKHIKEKIRLLNEKRFRARPRIAFQREVINLKRTGKTTKEILELVENFQRSPRGRKGGTNNYALVRKVLSYYGYRS